MVITMSHNHAPPFNCVLVWVGDHVIHSSVPFTCASIIKGSGRSGVYNTFIFLFSKYPSTYKCLHHKYVTFFYPITLPLRPNCSILLPTPVVQPLASSAPEIASDLLLQASIWGHPQPILLLCSAHSSPPMPQLPE